MTFGNASPSPALCLEIILGLFLFFAFLGTLLGGFGLGFNLVVDFLFLLELGIINAHAGQFVFDGHYGVAEQHAFLGAVHNGHKFLRLFGTKTYNRPVAAVTDGLGNAVRAAVHLGHYGGEQRRALRAELVALGVMMFVAVEAEGLFDIFLFFGNIVFDFYRFTLGQKTGKNAHFVSPFDYGYIIHSFILMAI